MRKPEELRTAVRLNYAKVAQQSNDCCTTTAVSCCNPEESLKQSPEELAKKMGYSVEELNQIPKESNMGLSCGNPHAIAQFKEGETVVDLGSGGGFDCFLAAKKVGETGYVIGVDMTHEMITKARQQAQKANLSHVEFRLGEIEHLPIADATADHIISNCVINLSTDKAQVFKEAYRILKPGGYLAISDVILTAELPESYHEDLQLYSGCISGAVSIEIYEELLRNAGFKEILIEPKDESKEFIRDWEPNYDLENYIVSALIQARK